MIIYVWVNIILFTLFYDIFYHKVVLYNPYLFHPRNRIYFLFIPMRRRIPQYRLCSLSPHIYHSLDIFRYGRLIFLDF